MDEQQRPEVEKEAKFKLKQHPCTLALPHHISQKLSRASHSKPATAPSRPSRPSQSANPFQSKPHIRPPTQHRHDEAPNPQFPHLRHKNLQNTSLLLPTPPARRGARNPRIRRQPTVPEKHPAATNVGRTAHNLQRST